MIREIRGAVTSLEATGIIVDVSGWGILVHTSNTEAFAVGDSVSLKTYLAVKQDGVDLYGFADAADLRFFELLLSVSGIGPKTALSVLRRAPRDAHGRGPNELGGQVEPVEVGSVAHQQQQPVAGSDAESEQPRGSGGHLVGHGVPTQS